ncbi:MAG: ATP-binding protein [Longicatena sp.]
MEFRDKSAKTVNIRVAVFPSIKRLKDFAFQPTIDKNKVMDFKTLRFLEYNENIVFQGYLGTRKTHLSMVIGIEAVLNRISTYYINCYQLILNQKKSKEKNKFEQKLKFYTKYKLLVIDEVCFLPIDKEGTYLFFKLISRRNETKSTIVPTNIQFALWSELFSDDVLASVILNRLLHHSHIIKKEGESYRLKDKI